MATNAGIQNLPVAQALPRAHVTFCRCTFLLPVYAPVWEPLPESKPVRWRPCNKEAPFERHHTGDVNLHICPDGHPTYMRMVPDGTYGSGEEW